MKRFRQEEFLGASFEEIMETLNFGMKKKSTKVSTRFLLSLNSSVFLTMRMRSFFNLWFLCMVISCDILLKLRFNINGMIDWFLSYIWIYTWVPLPSHWLQWFLVVPLHYKLGIHGTLLDSQLEIQIVGFHIFSIQVSVLCCNNFFICSIVVAIFLGVTLIFCGEKLEVHCCIIEMKYILVSLKFP